mgnify:CR=1 FL=1
MSDNILHEADRLTAADRQDAYDHPRSNHAQSAELITALLRRKLTEPITPREFALIMVCVKLSRDSYKPKRDNLVDIAGWVRTAEMLDE